HPPGLSFVGRHQFHADLILLKRIVAGCVSVRRYVAPCIEAPSVKCGLDCRLCGEMPKSDIFYCSSSFCIGAQVVYFPVDIFRIFLLALFAIITPLASAADAVRPVHPFVAGSLAKIVAEREGRPFVLAFWSVSCTHCPAELKMLGELRKRHPNFDVVLVAADSPDEAPRTRQLAIKYGLGQAEQWVFADEMTERLRFEIDRRWHGELPRTHFYDREHRITAVSGVVPKLQLLAWLKAELR
ncbi:MAG: TlpA disulfide reductase family protein, partial [Rhodocyclaceae bacterium]